MISRSFVAIEVASLVFLEMDSLATGAPKITCNEFYNELGSPRISLKYKFKANNVARVARVARRRPSFPTPSEV